MAGSKISVLDQRNRFLASNCDFFYLTYPWQNLGVSPIPLQNFFMPENICWFGGYPTPLRKRIRQVIFGGLPKGRPNIIHFWSKKRISLGTACNIKSLFGAEFHISAKPSVASGPEGRKIKRRQISFDCQYSSIFLANVEKRKSWMFFLILHIDTGLLRIDIALVAKIGDEVLLGGTKHQIVYIMPTGGYKKGTFLLKNYNFFRFYILAWQILSLANSLQWHFGKDFRISSLSCWPVFDQLLRID